MIEYGKMNSLRVVTINESMVVLDGEKAGEILLPKKGLNRRYRINENADVFIYIDSKDHVVVTARKPYAEAGQFALLKAVSSNSYGAFLDWGLEQDLRVPVREQQKKMRKDQLYLVYVYNEKNNRITASSRLSKFLKALPSVFKEGQRVDLVIGDITPIGYRAVINGTHLGVLYRNEVFQLLRQGQALKGYIKKIREDGKIDLCLQKRNARELNDLTARILDVLKEHGGILNISDKTSPDRIYNLFGVSKKRYKSAIGAMYKKRLITVEDHAIQLVPEDKKRPGRTQGEKPVRSGQKIKSGRKRKIINP